MCLTGGKIEPIVYLNTGGNKLTESQPPGKDGETRRRESSGQSLPSDIGETAMDMDNKINMDRIYIETLENTIAHMKNQIIKHEAELAERKERLANDLAHIAEDA